MATDAEPQRVVIPVVEETVTVEKQNRLTGVVHVNTRVHEDVEQIVEPLESVEVVVKRVPVGRWIDAPVEERQEGDTTIIPVMEEVAVVVKRLRLVEEVHVTRRRTTHQHRDRVKVRRTEVEVEREDGRREAGRLHTMLKSDTPARRKKSMTTTVIGLYQDVEPARRARKELAKAGLKEASILLFEGKQDDIVERLAEVGIDEEDGQAFAGAVAKGAAVIAVETEDDRADELCGLLEQHDAHAVDAYRESAEGEEEQESGSERTTLKEVEERIEVGKRRVVRGGVRARTTVTERPVEKQVTLEEEKVQVRERNVDRELSPEEAERAFKETSVEMTETAEEAQVRKAARLIGEVEVSKSTRERQETINETVRKTEVDVERIEADRGGDRKKR